MNSETAQHEAVQLLKGLVEIPSLSGQEAEAAEWLAGRMAALGYDRAYVDGAGNAVGELGSPAATRTVVLLGHIDTVPGNIPVRIEEAGEGPALYGRGSVDAKGPLAAFVWAAAQARDAVRQTQDARVVVVGAVEEEAATSRGARAIRDRFNGVEEPAPVACVIGEPSGSRRVTLGYKGRLLLDITAARPMAHSAGPDPGVATVPVAVWNYIDRTSHAANQGRPRAFDQLLPSLRSFRTWTDDAMIDRAAMAVGIRLAEGFDAADFVRSLVDWCAQTFNLHPQPEAGPQLA